FFSSGLASDSSATASGTAASLAGSFSSAFTDLLFLRLKKLANLGRGEVGDLSPSVSDLDSSPFFLPKPKMLLRFSLAGVSTAAASAAGSSALVSVAAAAPAASGASV